MQTLRELIERHSDENSEFRYYIKHIDEAEANEIAHPDITIECCTALFQGVSKTIVNRLAPPEDPKAFADGSVQMQVRAALKRYNKAELIARLDGSGLPFAPIGRPEDLFTDPHLCGGHGLAPVTLEDGTKTFLPVLPIALDGERLGGVTLPVAGADTDTVLSAVGMTVAEIANLRSIGAIE